MKFDNFAAVCRVDGCHGRIMVWEDLSETMQQALRAKFESEQRRDFNAIKPDHWSFFLELPDVAKLWQDYLADAWTKWMWRAEREEWWDFLDRALDVSKGSEDR